MQQRDGGAVQRCAARSCTVHYGTVVLPTGCRLALGLSNPCPLAHPSIKLARCASLRRPDIVSVTADPPVQSSNQQPTSPGLLLFVAWPPLKHAPPLSLRRLALGYLAGDPVIYQPSSSLLPRHLLLYWRDADITTSSLVIGHTRFVYSPLGVFFSLSSRIRRCSWGYTKKLPLGSDLALAGPFFFSLHFLFSVVTTRHTI